MPSEGGSHSGSDAGRGGRDKGDKDKDKGGSKGSGGESKGSGGGGEDKGTGRDSPGPIGGPSSYGMDRDTFDKTIGRDQDRGGGSKQEEKGILDKVTDFFHETVTDVEHWFKGEESTGFSPMGGPSSYGMEKREFDRTIGRDRQRARSLGERLLREIDYFQEAPMDYAADLLRNPLVAGGAAMTGLGMTAFGVQAVDAVMDMVQNETTPMGAVTSTLKSAIQHTPVGGALGPVKGIATAALDSPEKAAGAAGALVGSQAAGRAGIGLADALTDNPLAKAAIAAGSAAAGGWAGRTAMSGGFGGTSGQVGPAVSGMKAPGSKGSDRRSSPLVSSGEAAVEASQKLAEQSQQPVDLYARTVQQLPFYGLAYNPKQQQLPYYGV